MLLGQAHADQEQRLIARVCQRVHAFGQDRRAAREPGCDELRYRDAQIAEQRCDDDLASVGFRVRFHGTGQEPIPIGR